MSAALPILTDPALIALLEGPPGCPGTADASKTMRIDIGGRIISASSLNCTQPPIVAAQDEMTTLQQKYIP
jgi:hypothetical protein